MEKTHQIQWQPVIEMVIVLITILGSTIPLYLQNANQIQAIHQDMRDFHGRMERQDAEFRGKLALQDAEFKAYLMYGSLPQKRGSVD